MVPLAAPGLYFVHVREKYSSENSVPTVRAYLKRLPSGAYRVTVLAPSLLRPLFRMYPADTGEAQAVARAVGRALETARAECKRASPLKSEVRIDPVSTIDPAEVSQAASDAEEREHLSSTVPRSEQQHTDGDRQTDQHETAPVEGIAHRGNEVTQHRRPPRRVTVVWQGLL